MVIERSLWPDYFPDDCPPDDAYQDDQLYFRFCKSDKCQSTDFIPYCLLFPDRSFQNVLKSFGLSVYQTEDEAWSLLMMPRLRNKGFASVAKGSVKHGVIKYTGDGDGHFTWWLFKNEKPEEYFEIVRCI